MYVPLKDKKQIFSSRRSRRDFKYDYGVQRVENPCTIRYQWYSFSNYLFLENREGRKKSSRRELSIRHLTLFLKVEGGGGGTDSSRYSSQAKKKKPTVFHEKLICVDGVGGVGVGVYLL